MASIRKRGSNSYLIVVSRGYDYEGNRLKSVQKTVKPPKEYTPKQAEKWVKEQAILFEREVQHTPEPINRSITLAKYIEHWVADVGPKKLADSTYQRDLQDIRRILPALGNYKLTDLRKEVIREFYEEMRHSPRLDGRGNLSEKSVEGLHNTLCGILSAAVDEGYLTHNPAWRCYKPKGQKKERPVADEETVKKLITAFEGQSMKYETYFKLVLATGLRRGEACGLRWSDINWKKRTIHVQRGVVKLSHQESITKDPKTNSGDRRVYLSKEMCQLLKAWRKECEWDRAQTANETVSEDDYLFRQPNGKPMNPCTFTYRFKLILKANNLPLDLNVHQMLILRVNACCCLIQDNNGSILEHCPGDRNSLLFTAGKRRTPFTNHRVISVWQSHYEVMAAGRFCGGDNLFIRSVRAAEFNVILNGIPEQVDILKNHADIFE